MSNTKLWPGILLNSWFFKTLTLLAISFFFLELFNQHVSQCRIEMKGQSAYHTIGENEVQFWCGMSFGKCVALIH